MYYSTDFPLDEDHVNEDGRWLNGDIPGIDWGHFYTKGNIAFGVDGTGAGCPDATAVVTGTWSPDQAVEITAYKGAPAHWAEYEIRLRSDIRPKWCTGYELMWAPATPAHEAYLNIACWPGPIWADPAGGTEGDTYLFRREDASLDLDDGDVLKAAIVGNVITIYKNGVQVAEVTDPENRFTSGNPGIGVNYGSDLNGDYGIRRFTAWDSAHDPDLAG
jgi:hypothetical protein